MAEGLDTSWFDLKNYEPLKTLSIKDWASVLESRSNLNELYEYFTKQKNFRDGQEYSELTQEEMEDMEGELRSMADELKLGFFGADIFVDAYINEDYPEEVLMGHSFSTSSVDSLRNYQAWDIAKGTWPSRELTAFHNMRNEWQKPWESDEDDEKKAALIEVANAPYDFHFKQYLNRDYIHSSAHVVIDLDAPDRQIESDFRHWLTHYRKASGYRVPKKKSHEMIFTQNTFDYWVEHGLIPYLDLMLIAKIEGKKFPARSKVIELIFPADCKVVDTLRRLKENTEPEVERLLEYATRVSLLKQAASGVRKKKRVGCYENKKSAKNN